MTGDTAGDAPPPAGAHPGRRAGPGARGSDGPGRHPWRNTFPIPVAGRDFDARVAVGHDAPLTDSARVYRGDCVEVCSAGTLSFTSEFDTRAAGTRDEARQSRTTAVCAYCGAGCDLALHVQDNEIVKVTSPHDDPVTHGNLCVKGRFGFSHVRNRD